MADSALAAHEVGLKETLQPSKVRNMAESVATHDLVRCLAGEQQAPSVLAPLNSLSTLTPEGCGLCLLV